MDKPSVSIVIPAYNAQRTIGRALQALLQQTYTGPKEIIVVDDGSTDQTAQWVKSFHAVSYLFQQNQGPAAARNRGFQASQGEFVFFTDSDCVPQPDWIEKCIQGFSDQTIGVVCGSYGIANAKHLLARCIHREILFRHKNLMPDFPKSFGSYNFCTRRTVFESVQGFNTSYRKASGEDNDLCYKILESGARIYFARQALVDHFFPTRVGKYLKEQFAHGFWRARMYRDHPSMAKGDDYTFWKDIVEPPIVLVIFLLFALGLCFKSFSVSWALFFLAWLSLGELIFSFVMMKSLPESLFFAFVMLLRAFARTAGFLFGAARLFSLKST